MLINFKSLNNGNNFEGNACLVAAVGKLCET